MQTFLYIILILLTLLPLALFAKTNEEAISYYELALTEIQYVKGASLFEEALGGLAKPSNYHHRRGNQTLWLVKFPLIKERYGLNFRESFRLRRYVISLKTKV